MVVARLYCYDDGRNMPPVRSDQFVRFGEHLARHTELGDSSAQALSQELDIPYTTVVEWWRHLEFHRAILVAARDVRVDRARLLHVLTAHRMARLSPSGVRTVAMDPREIAHALTRGSIPFALGMLSAANEWAFFEQRRSVQIYAPRHALSDIRRLVPSEGGGPIRLEVFRENLAHLPVVRRGGVPITSAFQTLLDCRAHPEGGAHAAFLESQMLGRESEPRLTKTVRGELVSPKR